MAITLSHEIGRIGLLERENATIMNACLRELAAHIVAAFHAALAELGIEAPVYLSQNDGTLMSARLRRALPGGDVRLRPDQLDARRGLPLRPHRLRGRRHRRHDLGRRRPPARLPARGVGRGRDRRRAHELPDAGRALARARRRLARRTDEPTVGPQSVGYELTSRALVFGGDMLTATDLAVAAGLAEIGDPGRVAGLDAEPALARIEERIAETVDRMKTSADPIPVVVVGGGCDPAPRLASGRERARRSRSTSRSRTRSALRSPRSAARSTRWSRSRARPATRRWRRRRRRPPRRRSPPAPSRDGVRVVDVEDVPLAYLAGNATRIRVKAVGDLDLERVGGAAGRLRRNSTTSPSARRSSAPAVAATRTSESCSRRRPIGTLRPGPGGQGRRGAGRRVRRPLRDDGRADGDGREAAARRRGDQCVQGARGLLGREPTHTISIEAGGLNSTTPFVVAAQLGIPLVDADGMGRAFPEMQMIVADACTASQRHR